MSAAGPSWTHSGRFSLPCVGWSSPDLCSSGRGDCTFRGNKSTWSGQDRLGSPCPAKPLGPSRPAPHSSRGHPHNRRTSKLRPHLDPSHPQDERLGIPFISKNKKRKKKKNYVPLTPTYPYSPPHFSAPPKTFLYFLSPFLPTPLSLEPTPISLSSPLHQNCPCPDMTF